MFLDLTFLLLLIIATNWGFSRGLVKAVPPFFQNGLGLYGFAMFAAHWFSLLSRLLQRMKFPSETWLAICAFLVSLVFFLFFARMVGKVAVKIIDIILWDGLFSRIPGAFLGLAMMVFALNGLQILFLDLLPALSFPEKTRFQSLLFALADQSRLLGMGR